MVKNKINRGYTLLELMIVVVMVAILAAVAVPKLMQVSNRNKLGEVTNLFQETVADARALAVKSRRAVVVEVRDDEMWINLLEGTECNSDIRTRCFHNRGAVSDAANTNEIDLNTQEYQTAGVDMCYMRWATITGTDTKECKIKTPDSANAMGLCYNGSGQLWIRADADPTTACEQTASPSVTAWQRACIPWLASGAENIDSADQTIRFSGAEVRFNRFKSGAGECAAGTVVSPATDDDVEDVTRRVIVPAGGHPFVQIAKSGD